MGNPCEAASPTEIAMRGESEIVFYAMAYAVAWALVVVVLGHLASPDPGPASATLVPAQAAVSQHG
jgi:hypothetical protein